MLFGPSDDYVNAFKNLNNSWNFFLHDVGEPVPSSVKIMADAWTPYKARWKELESRTFSSASPDWTEVLAGLSARIQELNSAIRAWKAAGKKTVAALVDDSKLDIEHASSALNSATATVETVNELEKQAKDALPIVAHAVPWWVKGGLLATAVGAFYLSFKPSITVVEVKR